MPDPRLRGAALAALLLLFAVPALARAPKVPVEAFVLINAEWQAGGDLAAACAKHGVEQRDFGLYMADLQEHDPAGYDELMALSVEARTFVVAGQPLSPDLQARIRARGAASEEAVGEGKSAARWVLLLCAILIPGIGVGVHLGIARMRQGTHRIYLEPLVDRFDGELGTDVDLLLASHGGPWASYARLTAYAQLRGTFQRARFALTLEPESWGATNAGDMALVRGGPQRMLLAVSRGAEFPTQYAIASSKRQRSQQGRPLGGDLPATDAAVVAWLEQRGFSAEAIPDGVLLIKMGFDQDDLDEENVTMLLERALELSAG